MKKKLLVLILTATMTASCVACGNKTSNKENTTTTTTTIESTSVSEDIKVKEQEIKEDALTPLIDKGIITGIKDLTVEENTDIDLNELIYADANIIKSVDIDNSTVDYSKAGAYEVNYTITFDGNNLRNYINENDIDVDFDTDGDTIVVKTTVNVTVATKEETEKAITDGDTNVITDDTKESVKNDNKAKANDNAVISKPSSTAASSSSSSSDSSASGNVGNTGNGNSSNTGNNNSYTSNNGNGNNSTQNTNSNNNPAEPTKTNTPTESAHTHNYIEVSRTNATCTADGITTYQCSCGATKTEKNGSALGHHMVHHDAVTHTEQKLVKEAYDDSKYESRYVCNGCGKQFKNDDDALEHIMKDFFDDCENYYCDEIKVSGGYHDAVYETVTVTDSPAYDECDRCGAR